jgi:hypothetical protein
MASTPFVHHGLIWIGSDVRSSAPARSANGQYVRPVLAFVSCAQPGLH